MDIACLPCTVKAQPFPGLCATVRHSLSLQDALCAKYYLEGEIPLAVCLAYERKKGRQSPFYPFIAGSRQAAGRQQAGSSSRQVTIP